MKENLLKEIENFEKNSNFMSHNKMHVESLNEDKIELFAEIDENSMNPYGIVHGGLIFGLADTAMGSLAFLTGRKAVTIDSSINYLKPCKGDVVKCVATPIKVGKTIAVFKAEIYNDKNELAAIVNGNFMFIE